MPTHRVQLAALRLLHPMGDAADTLLELERAHWLKRRTRRTMSGKGREVRSIKEKYTQWAVVHPPGLKPAQTVAAIAGG